MTRMTARFLIKYFDRFLRYDHVSAGVAIVRACCKCNVLLTTASCTQYTVLHDPCNLNEIINLP